MDTYPSLTIFGNTLPSLHLWHQDQDHFYTLPIDPEGQNGKTCDQLPKHIYCFIVGIIFYVEAI